jgi:hypothetical protein
VKKIFVAVILSLIPVASHAAPFTGMQLYHWCSSAKGSEGDLACMAYAIGFFDGMFDFIVPTDVKTASGAPLIADVCPPNEGIGVSYGQVRLIIEKYLRDHPEELNQAASGLALSAMKGAFPCPSK